MAVFEHILVATDFGPSSRRALDVALDFAERYASIILTKMLTNDDPGYVDVTSPSGIGIGALVYNYDGDVYASDEGLMVIPDVAAAAESLRRPERKLRRAAESPEPYGPQAIEE